MLKVGSFVVDSTAKVLSFSIRLFSSDLVKAKFLTAAVIGLWRVRAGVGKRWVRRATSEEAVSLLLRMQPSPNGPNQRAVEGTRICRAVRRPPTFRKFAPALEGVAARARAYHARLTDRARIIASQSARRVATADAQHTVQKTPQDNSPNDNRAARQTDPSADRRQTPGLSRPRRPPSLFLVSSLMRVNMRRVGFCSSLAATIRNREHTPGL